ncbi:hypothetical protein [Streptomyces sp. Wb2n-11]|uniref:hypothetical protein n=1 Tax=Streptomyces sp. Wb2n-11 TaxID=1030533 RepID=UPI000B05EC47|nr:hypothetical protein [Streptomyces sp. Wb2n-11]
MSAHKPGTRIAAVRNADDTTVYLYGRGVYAGDFPRPGSGNWPESTRQMARNVIEGEDDNVDELRAADDAWMVRKLAETVEAGKRTQEEADRELAEYRRIRLEREARRAAMSVEDQVVELLTNMDLNPRLDLDGGGTVWGCECWWMPEEEFDKFLGGRTVVEVPEPKRDGS